MSPIPTPLRPMADGTPLGLELLREGWPYLSFSEKAELLEALLGPEPALRWAHQIHEVHDLVLADPNPLIRRLVSKDIRTPGREDPDACLKVKADPAFCVREAWSGDAAHPGGRDTDAAYLAFWTLPRLMRLKQVYGADNLDWLAGALLYACERAIPDGAVNTGDVLDVIVEFFTWRNIQGRPERGLTCTDGWYPDLTAGGWHPLWAALPRLPGGIRGLLLAYIPTESIAKAALDALDPVELQGLLRREDFDSGPRPLVRGDYLHSGSKAVRAAALSSTAWCLEDEVIGEAMRIESGDPEEKRKKLESLCHLASNYAGGSLAQLAAIRATLRNCIGELPEEHGLEFTEHLMNSRQSLVPYERLKEEVFELRLWYLACLVAVAEGGADRFPSKLGPEWTGRLKAILVPGDSWQTYQALKGEIRSHQHSAIVDALPVVGEYEIGTLPPELRGLDPFSESSGDSLVDHARRIASCLAPNERAVIEALSTALAVIHQDVGMVKQGLALAARNAQRQASRIRATVLLAAGLAVILLLFVHH